MFFAPFLLFIWTIFVLVAGCTSDAHAFLYHQFIHFQLNVSPNYQDLFITSDIHFTKKFYLIQKIGHVFAFGLFYYLLLKTFKKSGNSLIWSSLFAVFTEILQLYFNRNGRIFDMGIDFIGIICAYLLCKAFASMNTSPSVYETQS